MKEYDEQYGKIPNIPEEIAQFRIKNMREAPKKTTTTSPNKRRKHNHFPQGKTGYVPGTTSNPINIKIAKRG